MGRVRKGTGGALGGRGGGGQGGGFTGRVGTLGEGYGTGKERFLRSMYLGEGDIDLGELFRGSLNLHDAGLVLDSTNEALLRVSKAWIGGIKSISW